MCQTKRLVNWSRCYKANVKASNQKPVSEEGVTLGACARVTVVVLCVCVSISVIKQAATYFVYESKMWCYKACYGRIQIHELCEFRHKCFFRQFWHHLLILSFLTFPQLAIA